MFTGLRALIICGMALFPLMAFAAEINPNDLLNLSLEELSNIEVTSVSKKAEKETEAAAAIYVITQEDIRRSGATAIPELLRMVPGVVVAQSGSHDWTVASRGFNDQFSNKLLVLVDGRTVYSPLFSGVIWDVQDTMLEDIERIEVIRGPGATLFGANAVNGVINIITKEAGKTQGGLAIASAGNHINGIGGVRYGAKMGDDSYLRAYAKYTNYDAQKKITGGSANDNWHKQQAGFRSDSRLSESGKLTVQGDIYTIDEDSNFTIPDLNSATLASLADGRKAKGGNVLARWTEKQSPDSETSLQLYFDNAFLKTSFFNDDTNTADIDFQHTWTGWNRQEIVWGIGYRHINDSNDPSQQFSLAPSTRNDNLFNAFFQDKIALVPDSVFLTLGSKLEHNDYSGFEIQPSVRMSWLPAENQTVWGSVSRAVHTPSRFTSDAQQSLAIRPPGAAPLFVGVPTLINFTGNKDVDSEEMIAYELGYRIQPNKATSLDFSVFYNDYSNLFSAAFGTPVLIGGTYLNWPVKTYNTNSAHSVGGEMSAKWNISRLWQVAGSYSYINLQFDDKSGGVGAFFVGKQPKNMFNLRSTYLFPYDIEMSNALYYVSDLNGINIPGYYRFDTKLSYSPAEGIELSLAGQNLLRSKHREFAPFTFNSQTAIGRSVYGGVAIKF